MATRPQDRRPMLLLTLVAAAAVGAGAQLVTKHEAKTMGMSRLELHLVLSVVGSVASRAVSHVAARRATLPQSAGGA